MKDLDFNNYNASKENHLTKHVLLASMSLLIWCLPATHDFCVFLDVQTFRILNSSLQYSKIWQLLWAYLNHPNEKWLNVIFMSGLNILGIFSLPKSKQSQAVTGVIYFWLVFQFVLLITHECFASWLMIKRTSPSLVLTPTVNLAEVLNLPMIKISSRNCFPAGHALVLIFWSKFSILYSKKWMHKIIYATVIILLLPRLFSGAHWLSDIVFTTYYALLWFALAAYTPLFRLTKYIENPINLIGQKFRKQAGTA